MDPIVNTNFTQVDWSEEVASAARQLISLAIREDVGDACDWTTRCLVPPEAQGSVAIVARQVGVVAGLTVVPLVLEEMGTLVEYRPAATDGDAIERGQTLATLSGSAADILTAERVFLNFLGRLSGIASLTRRYVDAVAGTRATVYDTRKTTPGWRMLEKYAVRCGGGLNHRLGLHRAVMIKDNHVALAAQEGLTLKHSIELVRENLATAGAKVEALEVEVDTLEQLEQVLAASPDIVLLDNMKLDELQRAVAMRDSLAPTVALEASGGVNLDTIGDIARTGVDRISVGALTHSAVALDVGLDWRGSPAAG
ncbi:carboxylating nicotinate-nucleotide diphosphorylase [Aeoliella sp. ICT_H6.2]|uniref:Probable nicotinate-nucleotide pyrophosphorylase [carboxylating] n=1 Tax=Aeoliella straminimaris TaxID=2954799 RepID=A0A9X2FDL8_9BACT|nr:carboxylating nicotinate-nucleotide diphosphorylase [Aeoliella straminimaris]MCO6046278.1 carboxylating nicotinate-nucleotide diphosphorylase [Aeoliella straminimaris]